MAIEDPSWRWQRLTVEHAGLEPVPVPVDHEGLVVSGLDNASVDAVVVTPAHQYPTGATMSPERRRALVAWAQERTTLIVEDDYDAEYRFDRDPVSSLQGLSPDEVAFVGTVSKTLAPALRLGWVVPPSWLVEDVENELLVTGVTPPTLDQVALALFIAESELERHLRRMRLRYTAKRSLLIDMLQRHLPEAGVPGIAAGLHVLVRLPLGMDERLIASRARDFNVGVHELHRHCTTIGSYPQSLVLGFALPTENEIETGVRLLAKAASGRSKKTSV